MWSYLWTVAKTTAILNPKLAAVQAVAMRSTLPLHFSVLDSCLCGAAGGVLLTETSRSRHVAELLTFFCLSAFQDVSTALMVVVATDR